MYAVNTTEQSNEVIGGTGPILTAGLNAAQQFEVTTVQGQTIVSKVSSLAVEQGNNCFTHPLYNQTHLSISKMHTT